MLVVAPLRVAATTWPDEIQKWDHLSGLRFSVVVGTPKERMAALNADAEIFIMNRENLPWLVEKLDALEDIIEAANGKPVLVAYWFKHDLMRITERLSRLKIPHEQISSTESIARWNNGKTSVGLIHPASAGHGLNLQAGGSILCWFGLTWSLELYQQTNARLWRQGQKNTVVVQHIIAKGTIDERIMKALSEKDSTQQSLIDAVKAVL